MKRVIALLAALLLAVLPAAAGAAEFTPYDYHIKYTANGKYVVYEFPDVALLLPIEWEDAITVEQTDTGTAFFQTASYDRFLADGLPKGGFLFKLCASEDEDFRDLPAYAYLGYSENAGLHFYLTLPPEYTAYPDDPGIMEDYNGMAEDLETITAMARIAPSLRFYTDDLVSTDAGMS